MVTTKLEIGIFSKFTLLDNGNTVSQVIYDTVSGSIEFSERLTTTTTSLDNFWKLLNDAITWIGLIKQNFSIPITIITDHTSSIDWGPTVYKRKYDINGIKFDFEFLPVSNEVKIKSRSATTITWKDYMDMINSLKNFANLCRGYL